MTITGPGGVGKTHLAMVIAQSLQGAFSDGVCWVSLAAINNPELVASAVAEALEVKEAAANSLPATLRAFLRNKELLMVLDNCEQLLAAAPHLAELLEQCPRLTLLVTSRAVLRIRGEHVLPLFPLPLPDLNQGAVDIAGTPAVALFVARARAIEPRFCLSEANAAAVAEICWRLDGLPLALELAAAHIPLHSPRQILFRLSYRLDMFEDGRRDLPGRQRTLRSSLQWSYDLLPEEVQRLFRRLCFFTRDCTLTAITTICQMLGDDPLTVERGVGVLLDHSLLQQAESRDGDRQFGLLEIVRDFGLEELAASGEMERVRSAHAEYISHLRGVREEVHLYTSEQIDLQHQSPQEVEADSSVLHERSEAGAETFHSSDYPSGLTEREVQVLRLMVEGLTNKQIAKELVLSPHTINAHVTSIYNKINVHTRSAATRFACTYLFV